MITFTPSDRFFDVLVAFFASVSCLGMGLRGHISGTVSSYGPKDYITLEGIASVSGLELRFFPYDLMTILVRGGWPSQLKIDDLPISTPNNPNMQRLKGLNGVTGAMIESMYVQYFESVRPEVEANFSEEVKNWPAEWNFGRVVRNTFSHGGEIKFENPSATAVSWKNLTYSPSDNGRVLLYKDMTAVEVILLMRDMDSRV